MKIWICDRCGAESPEVTVMPWARCGDLCDSCGDKFETLRKKWREREEDETRKFMQEGK